jgi:hypothetical protein
MDINASGKEEICGVIVRRDYLIPNDYTIEQWNKMNADYPHREPRNAIPPWLRFYDFGISDLLTSMRSNGTTGKRALIQAVCKRSPLFIATNPSGVFARIAHSKLYCMVHHCDWKM